MAFRAIVQELHSFSPGKGQPIAIDTNVLLALTYPGFQESDRWRSELSEYETCVARFEKAGATLLTTLLNVAELARLVEKFEFELYKGRVGGEPTLKQFRRNSSERESVCEELRIVIGQVFNRLQVVSSQVPPAKVEDLRWLDSMIDCMDHLIVQNLRDAVESDDIHVLTDDGDFAFVEDIIVLTLNQRAINEARSEGKLRTVGTGDFFKLINEKKQGR